VAVAAAVIMGVMLAVMEVQVLLLLVIPHHSVLQRLQVHQHIHLLVETTFIHLPVRAQLNSKEK
jgi:hypothetical protein